MNQRNGIKRSRKNAMIGGVCAGIAASFGWSVTGTRVAEDLLYGFLDVFTDFLVGYSQGIEALSIEELLDLAMGPDDRSIAETTPASRSGIMKQGIIIILLRIPMVIRFSQAMMQNNISIPASLLMVNMLSELQPEMPC